MRQTLAFSDVLVVAKPEVFVARADGTFDGNGNVLDEATARLIRELLEHLAVLANSSEARVAREAPAADGDRRFVPM